MDDMGNSESSYFKLGESPEQKQERREIQARVKDGAKLLEDLLARFDARIAFYDSNKSIEVDITEAPEMHQKRMFVAQMMRECLQAERNYLETLKD